MVKGDPPKKCPSCPMKFPATKDGQSRYQKHYYAKHFKKKKKARPKKTWKPLKRRS